MSFEPGNFWVTRNRRHDAPQLRHPDGFDEFVKGKATGRINKMIGGKIVIGPLDEIDNALEGIDFIERCG